mgnify:CR=1 FL=1
MPIKTQSNLPAKEILENENIFVMDENRAMHQDIRPLQVCILNIMPVKQDTELQLLRALSNTPLQVDVTFLMVTSHVSQNTSANHLNRFYTTFEDIKNTRKGTLIIISHQERIISIADDTVYDEEYITQNYDYPILGKVPNLTAVSSRNYSYHAKKKNHDNK